MNLRSIYRLYEYSISILQNIYFFLIRHALFELIFALSLELRRRTLHLAYGQYNPDNLQIPHPESLILSLNNFIIVTPRGDDTREEIQRSYWDHR